MRQISFVIPCGVVDNNSSPVECSIHLFFVYDKRKREIERKREGEIRVVKI